MKIPLTDKEPERKNEDEPKRPKIFERAYPCTCGGTKFIEESRWFECCKCQRVDFKDDHSRAREIRDRDEDSPYKLEPIPEDLFESPAGDSEKGDFE